MTVRTPLALLVTGLAAVAVSAALTTGPAGGPDLHARTGGLLAAPAPVADDLPAFGGCTRLRQWYVDRALPRVGPWGFDSPTGMLDGLRAGGYAAEAPTAPRADGSAGPGRAAGSSATGSNVQEAGVDEPDTAKTDGRILVRVRGRHVVVSDVSTDRPRELSRLRVPGRPLRSPELLLVGDTVLVVGTDGYWGGPVPLRGPAAMVDVARPWTRPRTHLVSIDVSDPAAPRVTSDQRVDGSLVTARGYADGTVRAVVETGLPRLDFVHPGRHRTRGEARRENRRIVRRTGLDTWLPGIRPAGGSRHPVLDCRSVRHPRHPSGFGTLSVLTFAAATPGSYRATAVTAAGDLAYSSADRLYVATAGGRGTAVHAFAVDGAATAYLGSGVVPGTVRDRWSFDEYDGHLRVATAIGPAWAPRENAVVVLDDRLRVVGRVDGLGRREPIQSVRWFADLAVVVTFRQTDPLYTVDLAVPDHPRLLGALRIRGFSSYLHPLGGDLLLGVGQAATATGRTLGARLATFDVRDPRRVRRAGVLGLGRASESSVGWDPRGFTYLPDLRVALLPVSQWGHGPSTRVVAVRVGPGGSLERLGSWRVGPGPLSTRTLPLGGDRVALVDGRVRVVRVS